MIVILVCDAEHVGDVPVPLPQLVLAANMPTWAGDSSKKEKKKCSNHCLTLYIFYHIQQLMRVDIRLSYFWNTTCIHTALHLSSFFLSVSSFAKVVLSRCELPFIPLAREAYSWAPFCWNWEETHAPR